MAAPSSSYLNNGERIRLEQVNSSDTVIASWDAYIASYMYGAANIKTLFYLDAVTEVEITDNAGTVIRKGFIGLIKNNPSNKNYQMHNISRHYKGRLDDLLGESWMNEYIALNDGGLNTLADVTNPTIVKKEIGAIQLTTLFKSSYYDASTGHGYKYTINGGVEKTLQMTTVIPQNDLINGGPDIGDSNIQAGDTIVARAFIINPEGVRHSNTVSLVAEPRQVNMKYHSTYASEAYFNGATKTIFSGSVDIGTGSNLYADINMGIIGLTQGYYVLDNRWYEVRPATEGGVAVFNVVATGECNSQGWPVGDPIRDNGVRTLQMAFYNASSHVNPCSSYNAGNLPSKQIWLRQFDGKYYATETGPEFCDNGWYVWNGQYRQMFNGVATAPTACPISG